MDISRVLLDLLIVLAVSRVAAEASERLRQPAVLGEIALGIAIGPSVLAWIHDSDALRILGEIGVILLLFEVGRQMDLKEMRRVGGASMRVALIGVLAPMALGYAAMRALGVAATPALFLAAGITATSVGITARVFGDLRSLATPEARTVLGAAVADDVIGLLVLTVVVRVAGGERLQAGSIASMTAVAVGFVIVATAIGALLVPRILDWIAHRSRTEGTVMATGLVLALGFARLATGAKLAPIVGAFVAGLVVGRSRAAGDLHRKLTPLGHFFIPIFFLQIGIDANVRVFASRSVLGIASVLCLCAVAGKIVSGAGVRRGTADRGLVGIAMIPRGEVGLIFASLGLSRGILDARLYGVLLAVVLVTTVVTPPWMRRRIVRQASARVDYAVAVIEPDGGWLAIEDAVVELAAEPPASLAPRVALDAALACAGRRPGPRLVAWLTSVEPAGEWDAQLRRGFFAVLRKGSPRSWRLLDATGFVTHMLPDVASALARRARDPFDLDPESAPGFALVASVRALLDAPEPVVGSALRHPDLVLLAALARDVFSLERDPAASARKVAAHIGLEHADVLDVGFLAGRRDLLPAAAARTALDEDLVIDLATFVETTDRAAALFVLALADGELEPWERLRLRELHDLVVDGLAHPDLTGPSARDLVERRAIEVAPLARRPLDVVRARLLAAPRRSLLAHDAATLARHLDMTETRPGKFEARLRADFGGDETWTVHVALLDRRGALASIAGGLAAAGIGVAQADIATWRDGVAIDVFRVAAPVYTDWDAVRRRVEAALAAGPNTHESVPVEGEITIDNVASPWHSIVEVRATDRAGLLGRVAAALAVAGAQIHHATVTTRGVDAVDTFMVTGASGGKLDVAGERNVRAAFAGRRPKRFHAPWRRAEAIVPS